MKRNISDLLDEYREESVDLPGATPLSSTRIKELTMSKITESKKKETSSFRRAPGRLLMAAAVAAALSVSALAAGGILGAGRFFNGYFSREGEDLTQGQVAQLDQVGMTFEGGVTCNGATLTPLAAVADENTLYLRLRVEAPEGTVLPDLDPDVDGYYQMAGRFLDENGSGLPGYSMIGDWQPDSDPTDNVKEVVLRAGAYKGEDADFTSGDVKSVSFNGLWIQDPYKNYTPVFTGDFVLELGNVDRRAVDLDCTGLTFTNAWSSAQTYGLENGFTSTLTSVRLSPLSISYAYTSDLPENEWINPGVGDWQVVLKDGTLFFSTAVELTPEQQTKNEEHREKTLRDFAANGIVIDVPDPIDGVASSYEDYVPFDAPLDLSQVDYVMCGDYRMAVNVE